MTKVPNNERRNYEKRPDPDSPEGRAHEERRRKLLLEFSQQPWAKDSVSVRVASWLKREDHERSSWPAAKGPSRFEDDALDKDQEAQEARLEKPGFQRSAIWDFYLKQLYWFLIMHIVLIYTNGMLGCPSPYTPYPFNKGSSGVIRWILFELWFFIAIILCVVTSIKNTTQKDDKAPNRGETSVGEGTVEVQNDHQPRIFSGRGIWIHFSVLLILHIGGHFITLGYVGAFCEESWPTTYI